MFGFGNVNWVIYQGTETINMQEVKETVIALKYGEGVGLDNVTDEMIKNWGGFISGCGDCVKEHLKVGKCLKIRRTVMA